MPLWLLLLFSLPLFLNPSATITDTITPTRPLKDGQVLTSGEGGMFKLGFFSPGNSTRHRYIGVWFAKVPMQTVVWVANRDRPINGTDGVLSVAGDGNLVLSSNNSTVWSTEISHKSQNNTEQKAQLFDSGNLILVIGGRSQPAAWQSFDYPTHVFLPGMKLGFDRRTRFTRSLSSWRSVDDPAHGNFSFRVDLDGGSPEFFVYRDGSVPVWRTGPWVGQRWSGVPEMTRGYIFNYTFVDNPDEVYASYNVMNASIVTIFLLDGESGTVQRKTWHERSHQWIKFWSAPQDGCDDYASCGAFGLCNPNSDQFECSCFPGYQPKSPRDWYLRDGSDGCARAGNVSMCRNGEGFVKLANVKVPNTSGARTNTTMSLDECREQCLKNCSCSAYTTATDGGKGARPGGGSGGPSGCMVFHGDLVDTREYAPGGGQDLYLRVDAVELAKSLDKLKGGLDKKYLAIILVCGATTIITMASFGYWFYRKKRRERREEEERSLWLGKAEESDPNSDLPVFHLSAIVAATGNFNIENKLGEGGFGAVYKGTLNSGQEIAVKRLSRNSGQGIDEFKNEVRLIAKLQHRNLVKTLGCCVRGEEKMLIYEFLPNKSLDNYIFNEEKRSLLDWSKRYDIILGIAKGILYLHQDSRLRIIHRDLKASNILLDATMTPKISDFGMARIFGTDQNEANTNRVVGTYGYMSPEYAMEGLFSTKSDVFSFGVITLEVITGKKSSGYYNDDLSTNLIGYAWKLWQEGKAMEVVDQSVSLITADFEDEILKCIQIGLLCVQENPNERPTMLEVIFMLSNKSELPSPKEPAFIIKGKRHNSGDPISSSTGAHSVNDLTVTVVEAR